MKQLIPLFLSILLTASALAQGLTKNGKVTSTGSEYVNKNGAIGSPNGVDKNGRVVAAVSLPTVTTAAITSIRGTTATSGGTLISTGGLSTVRGVCWSTTETPAPTTLDNTLSQGAGALGNFTSNLTSLAQNTTYYLRAYATNSVGTAYGETVSFTTTAIGIGDSFQGGKVYSLETDENGIITGGYVVSENQPRASRTSAPYTKGTAISSGPLNGYKDWVLPTSVQLLEICAQKTALGINSNDYYQNMTWSSDPMFNEGGYSWGIYVDFESCYSARSYTYRGDYPDQTVLFYSIKLIRHFVL